jgi:anti-sigma factor RsiW
MSEHIDRYTLDAYVEQTLSVVERRAVEAHVTACPMCQARLAYAKQMIALLYDLPRERPAMNLAARINLAVSSQRPQPTLRWMQVAVLAGLVFGLVLLVLSVPHWIGSIQSASLPTDETISGWWNNMLSDPAATVGALVMDTNQMLADATEQTDARFTIALVVLALASVAALVQLLDRNPTAPIAPA